MKEYIDKLKNDQKFNKYYEKYMYLIAILGASFLYVQAYRIYEEKSSKDVSTFAFWIVLFVSLNWLIYGFLLEKKVILLSSILGIIGAGIVIYLCSIYP